MFAWNLTKNGSGERESQNFIVNQKHYSFMSAVTACVKFHSTFSLQLRKIFQCN